MMLENSLIKTKYNNLVQSGYDSCAEKYMQTRRDNSEPSLRYVFDRIPKGGSILDAGCGSGIPIAKLLSDNYQVTGIDISPKQIALSRKNVPNAQFICGDFLKYEFKNDTYDAIVCLYALFHVDRKWHQKILTHFYNWLKPGGILFISLSENDEEGYTENDFFGTTMFWSNWGIETYRTILKDIGFTIVLETALGHGYEDFETPEEYHPLVMLEKLK